MNHLFAPDMLIDGRSDYSVEANVSIEAHSRLIVKFMDKIVLKYAAILSWAWLPMMTLLLHLIFAGVPGWTYGKLHSNVSAANPARA